MWLSEPKTAKIRIRTPLKSDIYFRFMVSETSDVESITFLYSHVKFGEIRNELRT